MKGAATRSDVGPDMGPEYRRLPRQARGFGRAGDRRAGDEASPKPHRRGNDVLLRGLCPKGTSRRPERYGRDGGISRRSLAAAQTASMARLAALEQPPRGP